LVKKEVPALFIKMSNCFGSCTGDFAIKPFYGSGNGSSVGAGPC
jgi:hypothetical protein